MQRKLFWMIPAMLMLAMSIVVFVSSRTLAQDHGKDGAKSGDSKAGMQMPSKEDMEKMMAMGNPGPEHKEMMKSVGDWDAEVHFMMGGQPGPAMRGTAHIEPLFDGRYLVQKYDGVMNMGMGDQPFQGMAISGYDRVKKQYFNMWMDTMNTGVMKTEGQKVGNTLTLTGKIMDETMTKEVPVKEVVIHTDDDHMTYQMFGNGPDGKEMQVMEIKYTRKK